jgi:NAD(P)-dependent dehydrogenase (short-subunit alcohol dehydrogenase family)
VQKQKNSTEEDLPKPSPAAQKPANLAGKLALVTGGSRGIGRAIAMVLAEQGANLILVGRQELPLSAVKSELENRGVICRTLACDLAEMAKLTDLLEPLLADLGSIDILVNNAGIFKTESVISHKDSTWNETLAVNLTAAFQLCRYAVAGMIAKNWGRVVNISSVSGKLGEPYGAAYSASKFGLIGLTQSLALEVAKYGVTVNAICPGWVLTEMARKQLADDQWCRLNSIDQSQSLEIARLSIPQERFIEEEEIAHLTLFLCSNQGKGITGQSINVCGGLSLR